MCSHTWTIPAYWHTFHHARTVATNLHQPPIQTISHMPIWPLGTDSYQPWASECPDVKNYKWRLNPVWQRMLYSCTHMATVGNNLYFMHLSPWEEKWKITRRPTYRWQPRSPFVEASSGLSENSKAVICGSALRISMDGVKRNFCVQPWLFRARLALNYIGFGLKPLNIIGNCYDRWRRPQAQWTMHITLSHFSQNFQAVPDRVKPTFVILSSGHSDAQDAF